MQKVIARVLLMLLFVNLANAQSRSRINGVVNPDAWITTHFAKSKVPPFSFEYAGKPSATFIKKWKHRIQKDAAVEPGVAVFTITYTDPVTKLRVDCKAKAVAAFQVVEWVLHFTNDGSQPSANIKNVKALDLAADYGKDNSFNLYHSQGSDHHINDFRLHALPLVQGSVQHMEPDGGRSSDKTAFPFFNIESAGNGGIITAVGWSGTWFSDIVQQDQHTMQFSAGMKNFDLFLYPGESVRTPMISLLFWQGNQFIRGHNQFRQFVLQHHSRKINGKFAEYPLSGGFEWGDPAPCNEYTCLTEEMAVAFIKRYKQFGIVPEVFWLDAGWYAGSGGPDFTGKNWWNTIGNWYVDSARFPNGLKPLSDEAHKAGAKFMLWFEPERVMAGSDLAVNHPQWMLKKKGDTTTFLFDLGNKGAREWLGKYIGDFLEANGIDYYRQDFNMHIQPYWQANDEPGRTGIREIRHIEGLYAYWDCLLQRFPDLLIDNCASGGRRLDLETTSRSAPLWRTDYSYGEPNGYQNHSYGLNFYLPLHGTGVFGFDEYSFHSALSSAMVLNWDLTSLQGNIGDMRRYIQQFKDVRSYYYNDYYPLTGLGDLSTMNVWIAYQLNRPSDQSGIVLAFRRKENTENKLTVSLQGLDDARSYAVTNADNKTVVIKTGKELRQGFDIEISKTPGSVLLQYKAQ
ncbi:MAG: glycoside hydrolase family 36 protein [Agriterribacter sp.]